MNTVLPVYLGEGWWLWGSGKSLCALLSVCQAVPTSLSAPQISTGALLSLQFPAEPWVFLFFLLSWEWCSSSVIPSARSLSTWTRRQVKATKVKHWLLSFFFFNFHILLWEWWKFYTLMEIFKYREWYNEPHIVVASFICSTSCPLIAACGWNQALHPFL